MQLRTLSPRNSRRSLLGKPWLRCVSASRSSAGDLNSYLSAFCSRSASPLKTGRASRFRSMESAGAPPALRLAAAGEIDQQADVVEQRDLLGVGEANHHLAPVLADVQVLRGDAADVVHGGKPFEALADVGHGALAVRLRDGRHGFLDLAV